MQPVLLAVHEVLMKCRSQISSAVCCLVDGSLHRTCLSLSRHGIIARPRREAGERGGEPHLKIDKARVLADARRNVLHLVRVQSG